MTSFNNKNLAQEPRPKKISCYTLVYVLYLCQMEDAEEISDVLDIEQDAVDKYVQQQEQILCNAYKKVI